jgi:hypothetical protein
MDGVIPDDLVPLRPYFNESLPGFAFGSTNRFAASSAEKVILNIPDRIVPVTDLQSRNFGQKADQVMSSVQSAARNFDTISQQLHQTLTTALGPDGQGVDAGTNIRQSLSSLNQAIGNMAEDTEALKHEFFFRGFFKHRGYHSLANLNP